MSKVKRSVSDLEKDARRVFEAVLGERLLENQVVVLEVFHPAELSPQSDVTDGTQPGAKLPAWCNVYEGLSDAEIVEIENLVRRRSDLI